MLVRPILSTEAQAVIGFISDPTQLWQQAYFSLIGLMAGRSLTFPLAEWPPFRGGLQNPSSVLPLILSVLASSTKQR